MGSDVFAAININCRGTTCRCLWSIRAVQCRRGSACSIGRISVPANGTGKLIQTSPHCILSIISTQTPQAAIETACTVVCWQSVQRSRVELSLVKGRCSSFSALTGSLNFCGDTIAQLFVDKRPLSNYDLSRSLRFACFGLVVGGPGLRYWYQYLDVLIKSKTTTGVFGKVLLDQILMAPAFYVVFLSYINLSGGKSVEATKDKFKKDFFPVLFANYKLWPMAQMVNFYFVPLTYRVLYVSSVALGWNTYLTWRTQSDDFHE